MQAEAGGRGHGLELPVFPCQGRYCTRWARVRDQIAGIDKGQMGNILLRKVSLFHPFPI